MIGTVLTKPLLLRAVAAVVVLLLLLGGSIWLNIRQWADHRAYVKSQSDKLALAAAKAANEQTLKLAELKSDDNAALQQTLRNVSKQVSALRRQLRAKPLPVQCVPGKARMAAVNKGADE